MKYRGIAFVIGGMVFLGFGCGGGKAVEPADDGTLNITMDDPKFIPDSIELKSGRKVRMVLNNNSSRDNGFAIGLDVLREGGTAKGFKNHFFDGVEVKVTGPAKRIVPGDTVLTHEGTGAVVDNDGVLSISNIGTDRDPRELLLWRANAEFPGGRVVASAPIDRS